MSNIFLTSFSVEGLPVYTLRCFFNSSYAINCSAPWDTPSKPAINPWKGKDSFYSGCLPLSLQVKIYITRSKLTSKTTEPFHQLIGYIHSFQGNTLFLYSFKLFVSNAPFLYPLKASENRMVFWYFQGVEKECIGNKWVKRQNISEISQCWEIEHWPQIG